MPIEFQCLSCEAPQKAADHLAGRTLKCYRCGTLFTVPARAVLPPSLPAPGAAFEISTGSIDLSEGAERPAQPGMDDDVQFT
jgi:hypothetical protein